MIVVALECDGCGREYEHGIARGCVSAGNLDQWAHDEGWLRRGDRHYCPECRRLLTRQIGPHSLIEGIDG